MHPRLRPGRCSGVLATSCRKREHHTNASSRRRSLLSGKTRADCHRCVWFGVSDLGRPRTWLALLQPVDLAAASCTMFVGRIRLQFARYLKQTLWRTRLRPRAALPLFLRHQPLRLVIWAVTSSGLLASILSLSRRDVRACCSRKAAAAATALVNAGSVATSCCLVRECAFFVANSRPPPTLHLPAVPDRRCAQPPIVYLRLALHSVGHSPICRCAAAPVAK